MRGGSKRRSKIWLCPAEEFSAAVAAAKSYSDLAEKFGYPNGGSPFWSIKERVKEDQLDTSHFRRRGQWTAELKTLLPSVVLVQNSPHRQAVARRKFKEITETYVCEECGQGDEWNGKPLVLQMDHENGNNRDHRPENLRWLCPNCHTQTATFAGRNCITPPPMDCGPEPTKLGA